MIIKSNYNWSHSDSDIVAEMFEMSSDKGYNSVDIYREILTSKVGNSILIGNNIKAYVSPEYMLKILVDNTVIKEAKNSEDIVANYKMHYVGYFIKEVMLEGVNPLNLYNIATLEYIVSRYRCYHTQDPRWALERLLIETGENKI